MGKCWIGWTKTQRLTKKIMMKNKRKLNRSQIQLCVNSMPEEKVVKPTKIWVILVTMNCKINLDEGNNEWNACIMMKNKRKLNRSQIQLRVNSMPEEKVVEPTKIWVILVTMNCKINLDEGNNEGNACIIVTAIL